MGMATIQDVAKKAQVGVGTVSRVLSGNGYVKEETKIRVKEAIKELNYTPNQMARNLFFKKTGLVAVIVPYISHPFFAEFIDAAAEELSKYDYSIMVCSTENELKQEEKYMEMLRRSMVDGVIFGAHKLDKKKYQAVDRPIVSLDRNLGKKIPCVAVDHIMAGRRAAEILIQGGCKYVVQVMGSPELKYEVLSPSEDRHTEFARVMRERGIPCRNVCFDSNSFYFHSLQDTVKKLMEEYDGWDGFFGTDLLAMYCVKYAQERGLRIPEDIQVVSVDGTNTTTVCYPEITSIVQPIGELAKECVRQMMLLIQGKREEASDVVLDIEVKIGSTTKQPVGNPF